MEPYANLTHFAFEFAVWRRDLKFKRDAGLLRLELAALCAVDYGFRNLKDEILNTSIQPSHEGLPLADPRIDADDNAVITPKCHEGPGISNVLGKHLLHGG